ncbi:MAG: proliferating cell nuclear antigen (pcna) [archaeon]
MLLKLDQPKLLSDAIGIIYQLVTEVRAKVTKNGFSIIAIDPANVALVTFKLPATAFSQFKVEEDEELGLNLEDLKAVLGRCNSSSSLVLETADNTLRIDIQDKNKRSFTLALIDIDAEEKQVPQLEFNSRVEINSSILGEAIQDASVVADACTFITKKKEGLFIVEAKGSINSARAEFGGDEVKMQVQDEKSKYSIEYFQKFMKGAKISEKAVLSFSTNYPCRLDFKNSIMELGFILAPRVENDDD